VFGRVTVEGTSQGIPGLLVEAINPSTRTASRFGAVATDADGAFVIPLPAQRLGTEAAWWDVQVQVLAPERRDLTRDQRVLFTTEVRRQAGGREFFAIEIPREALEQAGVQAPDRRDTEPETIIRTAAATRVLDLKAREARDDE